MKLWNGSLQKKGLGPCKYIVRRGDRLYGYNTDAMGFLRVVEIFWSLFKISSYFFKGHGWNLPKRALTKSCLITQKDLRGNNNWPWNNN